MMTFCTIVDSDELVCKPASAEPDQYDHDEIGKGSGAGGDHDTEPQAGHRDELRGVGARAEGPVKMPPPATNTARLKMPDKADVAKFRNERLYGSSVTKTNADAGNGGAAHADAANADDGVGDVANAADDYDADVDATTVDDDAGY